MNYFFIFLTGLTTGGISCTAMQGGLLASVIASQKKKDIENKSKSVKTFDQLDWLPVASFLIAKLFIHTLLGFFLGFLGTKISLNLTVTIFFQILVAVFMLFTAFNLLDLHPFFRFIAFKPPKFLQKIIRKSSKSEAIFAPAVLGLLSIFIPCGVTQAMEVQAINSANPLVGALIMFFFVLGTVPIFSLLGLGVARFSEQIKTKFLKITAYFLIILAVFYLNGVMLVVNSKFSLNNLVSPVKYFFSEERFSQTNRVVKNTGEVQKITIEVLSRGYRPNKIVVNKNQPVELTLVSNGAYSCALDFVFKEFNIRTRLSPNDKQVFNFIPEKKGKFIFSCSMGMYAGSMEVK
jgi:uncharacterized protein